jgi:hypothetical protein
MLYVRTNLANLLLIVDLIVRRPDIQLLSASDGKCSIQAVRILAENPATAHIRLIALSARSAAATGRWSFGEAIPSRCGIALADGQ